jgi:hypothetical protein
MANSIIPAHSFSALNRFARIMIYYVDWQTRNEAVGRAFGESS